MNKAQLERISNPDRWHIRISQRARNLRIQVYPHGGVEVVVPRRTTQLELLQFIDEHREWAERTRREFRSRRDGEPLLPSAIALPAVGANYAVHYASGKPAVREAGDTLLVFVPEQTPEHCWPALQGWLKRSARRHFSGLLTELSRETGLQPSRLQVRLQKTRWGSCSASGTISLNAAGMLRSAAELRYIVIHELCHLRHMNHGRRFWQLVERFEPDYRELDRRIGAAWQDNPLWLS